MGEKVFIAYSRYYDLLYREKNYTNEAKYIKGLLTRFGISKGYLLEFGSGTGKHAGLLGSYGYNLHGIERSAEMVAIAESSSNFTCQQGDISDTKMGRTYDAVLSLFHVISYQTKNDQLDAVFSNAADHLLDGGLFIFDFWYSPAVYTQKPEIRVRHISDNQVEITRIAEPVTVSKDNCVIVNYTIYENNKVTNQLQVIKESHVMRHFSLPEIDLIANKHGFKRIKAEEFETGKEPSESTWGICVILKKEC